MNKINNIYFCANSSFKKEETQPVKKNTEVSMQPLQHDTVEIENKQKNNNNEKRSTLSLIAGLAIIGGVILLALKKHDTKAEKKIVQGLSDTFESNRSTATEASSHFSSHNEPWHAGDHIGYKDSWNVWEKQFDEEWVAWENDFNKKWETIQEEWAKQDAEWAKQTAEWEKQTAEWEKWAKDFKNEPNAESFHNDIPFGEKTNQHSTSSAKPKVTYEHPGISVFKKYGQDLGDVSTLSKESLKKAYIELVKKHHPDANKGNETAANEILKEINHARDLLIKEIKMRETHSC